MIDFYFRPPAGRDLSCVLNGAVEPMMSAHCEADAASMNATIVDTARGCFNSIRET